MKRLIAILLFLPLFGVSQPATSTITLTPEQQQMYNSLRNYTTCMACGFSASSYLALEGHDCKRIRMVRQPVTVFDVMDYATKCYNDSTVEYFYKMCDGPDCWKVPCEKGECISIWESMPEYDAYCPAHWYHKEPTFSGFIEYLKKKK